MSDLLRGQNMLKSLVLVCERCWVKYHYMKCHIVKVDKRSTIKSVTCGNYASKAFAELFFNKIDFEIMWFMFGCFNSITG